MSPLERIEALKAEYEDWSDMDGSEYEIICRITEEAFALASELAAESEWRPVSEEPTGAPRFVLTHTPGEHDGPRRSWWSGPGSFLAQTTHWRPMPRGPER